MLDLFAKQAAIALDVVRQRARARLVLDEPGTS